MTELANGAWPTAELDSLRRLQVIAATAAHPMYAERTFDAPVHEVWRVASDLEAELPRIVKGLRSFATHGGQNGDAERFSATAVSTLRHHERFDVVLRPGWCLMQSRAITGGMAAVREGSGTRFAMLCMFRFPGGKILQGSRLFRAAARSEAMLDRLDQRIAERCGG